jgi:hypothetical protein
MNHETSWHKDKAAFDDLCKLWDKAQTDGIFNKDTPASDKRSDFFGQYDLPEEVPLNDDDVNHWSSVISRSGELVPDESMMLMETAKKKAAEKKLKESAEFSPVKTTLEKAKVKPLTTKVKDLANNPQFVKPDTYGTDSLDPSGHVKVTAGLAAHPNFEALVALKKELELAEIEMSDRNGLNEKRIAKLEAKFIKMREELEKLSKSAGDYEKNQYYS